MIKILFVCHGNICRSPMAEYVMKFLVNQKGLENNFYIDSAATSTEEIGNGVHYGTRNKLKAENIPVGNHRARQITIDDYNDFDYLIGMDSANIRNMKRILGEDTDNKIFKLLEFANLSDDIADPWYTGNFNLTYNDILKGCKSLLNRLT